MHERFHCRSDCTFSGLEVGVKAKRLWNLALSLTSTLLFLLYHRRALVNVLADGYTSIGDSCFYSLHVLPGLPTIIRFDDESMKNAFELGARKDRLRIR